MDPWTLQNNAVFVPSFILLTSISPIKPLSKEMPAIWLLILIFTNIFFVKFFNSQNIFKKAMKNDIRRACSQKNDVPHTNSSMYLCFVTQSFLLGFSWSSDITASNKKNTSKTLSVYWDIYIILVQNYYNSTICQYGLFKHTCLSKNAIVSKDTIFYLLWRNMI